MLVAGVLLLVSGIVVVIAPVIGELREELRFQRDVVEAANADAAALEAAAIDQETGERGFLLTGRAEFLSPYEQGRAEARARLDALAATDGVDGLPEAVSGVDTALAAWQTLSAEPEIEIRRDGGDVGPRVLSGAGRRLFEEVRAGLSNLDRTLDAETVATRERIDDTLRRLVLTLLIAFGAASVAAVAVGLLLRRWITEPVDQLVQEVDRVADGDFERPVRLVGPRELVAVARAVDEMRREMVERLTEATRAREALEQRAPAVVALWEELAPAAVELPPGIEVVTRHDPAEGLLAGDFADVIPLGDGRVAAVVADASGHGAPVAVRALRAKHLLGAALANGLSPAQALGLVAPRIGDGEGWFVTAFVLIASPDGTVVWAGAGHPPALLRSPAGFTELASTGPVLGPLPGPWEDRTLDVERPWAAVLVTDGLLEARDGDRVLLGDEPLRTRLGAADLERPGLARAVIDGLLDDVREHLGGARPSDDLTIVAVHVGWTASDGELEPDGLAAAVLVDTPTARAAVDDQEPTPADRSR